jgi:general secretion pathway protein I
VHASSRIFSRGFTLIEVLAALVIVSLGMLGVIEAIGQTASNSTRMRDRTIAHWIAMNRLTTARLETRAPNIGKTSDEVEMAGRRWRWTMEVSETPVQTMRRIDVSVGEAENEDDERTLAVLSGFYGSAIAPTGTAPPWTGVPGGPNGPGGPGTEQPPQDDPDSPKDEPPPDPQDGGGGAPDPEPDPDSNAGPDQ